MLLNYFYEVSYKPVLLSFLQYHHKFLLYALLLELIVENLNKTTREPKKVILKTELRHRRTCTTFQKIQLSHFRGTWKHFVSILKAQI